MPLQPCLVWCCCRFCFCCGSRLLLQVEGAGGLTGIHPSSHPSTHPSLPASTTIIHPPPFFCSAPDGPAQPIYNLKLQSSIPLPLLSPSFFPRTRYIHQLFLLFAGEQGKLSDMEISSGVRV
ncbi:hypothetical protein HOY82DRAFT_19637 [Tuber indicum]|nr:hypothetical protein HOY82DRAFT_19637 [Tuber indicum]